MSQFVKETLFCSSQEISNWRSPSSNGDVALQRVRFNKIILDSFTAVICALIAWHSAAFVRTSFEFGDTMLGDVPAWLLQMVLPVGFALISWRYALFALRGILGAGRPEPKP